MSKQFRFIMGFWSFVDVLLLAAAVASIVFSVVMRKPDLMVNFSISTQQLNGESSLARSVATVRPDTLSSWLDHGRGPPRLVDCLYHRCALPHGAGYRLHHPQLDAHARRRRYPRGRDLPLVLHAPHRGQLPRRVAEPVERVQDRGAGRGASLPPLSNPRVRAH